MAPWHQDWPTKAPWHQGASHIDEQHLRMNDMVGRICSRQDKPRDALREQRMHADHASGGTVCQHPFPCKRFAHKVQTATCAQSVPGVLAHQHWLLYSPAAAQCQSVPGVGHAKMAAQKLTAS